MDNDKPPHLLSKAEGGDQKFYQVEDGWIGVYSGGQLHFKEPRPGEILILDIAHSIGKLCRYGGHTKRFYSVAEHSARLAQYIARLTGDTRLAFEALMHDASEGYLVDMPRPIKAELSQYKAIERILEHSIALEFGLREPRDVRIHEADTRILVDEKAQAMMPTEHSWGVDDLDPLGVTVQFWTPDEGPHRFLTYFHDLNSRRMAGMPPGDLLHG